MNTYDDPIKQKSRETLEAFIRAHLSFRRPKDLRVLCLPGAEIEGQEAIEVKEVYDKIGIPRENITGIEGNRESARLLEAANLGITIIPGDIDQYLRETNRQFDVISLDYCGQQTHRAVETLAHIGGRGLLRDHAVLATNYATKRLSLDMQRTFAMRRFSHQLAEAAVDDSAMRYGLMETTDTDRSFVEAGITAIETGNIDLTDARESITTAIEWAMWGGKYALAGYNLEPPIALGGPQQREKFTAFALKALRKAYESHFDAYRIQWGDLKPDEIPLEQYAHGSMFLWRNAVRETIGDWIAANLHMPRPDSLLLAEWLTLRGLEPFMITQHDRYKYTSNKNENMYLDLVAVRKPRDLFTATDRIIRYNPDRDGITFNPEHIPQHKWKRANDHMLALRAEYATLYAKNPSERVDLGSSWKRKPHARVPMILDSLQQGRKLDDLQNEYALPKRLTKEQGLALREAGVTSQQFFNYFDQPPMRVAGWAAHATRKATAEQSKQ